MHAFLQRITSGRPGCFLLALSSAAASGLAVAAACQVFVTSLLGPADDVLILKIIGSLGLALFGFSLLYPVAAVVSVVFGLALHLPLVVARWQGWRPYALAGVLAGLVCWYALDSLNSMFCGDTSNPCSRDLQWSLLLGRVLFWGVVPSVGGALTFWAVLRPDRAATGAPESAPPG